MSLISIQTPWVPALVCALSVSACSSASKSAAPSPALDRSFRVIDVHVHTDFGGGGITSESGVKDTEEGLIQEMKEAGVVGAVSHSPSNQWDVKSLESSGVIHCAGLKARYDAKKLEQALSSGRFKCIKIYLGYEHQYAYDRAYEPAYRLAEKYDVPVVFHTGDTYTWKGKLKYADPLTIDEVAVDHPKVRFVIAHCGNPWIQSAAEVAYKNANVYLECSALLIGKLGEAPAEKTSEYVVKPIAWIFGYVENPKKLMFGTDWPLTPMKDYIELYKKAIPKEHWDAVFYENAARVFKIPTAR